MLQVEGGVWQMRRRREAAAAAWSTQALLLLEDSGQQVAALPLPAPRLFQRTGNTADPFNDSVHQTVDTLYRLCHYEW